MLVVWWRAGPAEVGLGRRGWGILVVLRYADLPQVRAWWVYPQLDFAGVFAVWKPESVLRVLL
jgi:hypothetical protein